VALSTVLADVKEMQTKYDDDGEADLFLGGCSCYSSDVFLDECTGLSYIFIDPVPAIKRDFTCFRISIHRRRKL
jgi:hypothetical protein